jgi:hypothetical protein
MSTHELKDLLDQVPDTRELVLRREAQWSATFEAWCEAREEAFEAYRVWDGARSVDAYTRYRAAQDREDAAQDALATSLGRAAG